MAGVVYLIPTPLGEHDGLATLSAAAIERVRQIDRYAVEVPKTARAFLKAVGHPKPLPALAIETIPGNDADIDALLASVSAGHDLGVLSEAGAPAVADPGAAVVRRAHALGLRVVPVTGPSAIILALMASGLEGQRFAFHGYLPIDEAPLGARLRALEAASRRDGATQVFIETPYRNDRMLRAILQHCAPATRLCVSSSLTQPDETIRTATIAEWRHAAKEIGKRPTVFLLQAEPAARSSGGARPRL